MVIFFANAFMKIASFSPIKELYLFLNRRQLSLWEEVISSCKGQETWCNYWPSKTRWIFCFFCHFINLREVVVNQNKFVIECP